MQLAERMSLLARSTETNLDHTHILVGVPETDKYLLPFVHADRCESIALLDFGIYGSLTEDARRLRIQPLKRISISYPSSRQIVPRSSSLSASKM